jgi:hypothetical protein
VSSGHNKPSQVNSEEEDLDASGGLSESEGGPDISDTNDKRRPIDAMEVAGHYVSSGGTVLHKLAPCPVSLSNLIKVLIINCDCPPQLAQTYATIIPTTLVPTFIPPTDKPSHPRMKEKICTGHLPPRLVPWFNGLFSPHLWVIFGNSAPWAAPSEDDIKNIWAEVFPEEDPLDYATPLGGIVQKLVSQLAQRQSSHILTITQIVDHLSGWRHNLGNTGLVVLQSKVFPALPDDDNITRVRSEWCRWAVSCTKGDHLFYFADIFEDEDSNILSQSVCFISSRKIPELTHAPPSLKGIFQSKLISAILGSHINSILPLHINVKADRPIGALVLAIQSMCGFPYFLCSFQFTIILS